MKTASDSKSVKSSVLQQVKEMLESKGVPEELKRAIRAACPNIDEKIRQMSFEELQ